MDTLGTEIRRLRSRQGLSQRQLALLAGVSNATVSLIEAGRTDPSLGMLKRILDALGVSFAEFFSSRRSGERSESTRLNSSHVKISYAVFCLKKKNKKSYRPEKKHMKEYSRCVA